MIYIVDDAADYRFLVQQVFKLFLPQYPLRLLADGLELIKVIDENDDSLKAGLPKVILLDMDMPKLSGTQTLEKLRQLAGWQSVPVIMMSNRADESFMRASYELGACSFLLKPLGLEQMKRVMGSVCNYWLEMNQYPAIW